MMQSDLHHRLTVMLIMGAGGAACAFGWDLLWALRQMCKKSVFAAALDILYVCLFAALLLALWYRIDRISFHYTVALGVIFGCVLYRFGAGVFVRLCLEKWFNTIYCGTEKSAKKT